LSTVASWHRKARVGFLIFTATAVVAGLNGGALLFMNSMGWQVWGNEQVKAQGNYSDRSVFNVNSAKTKVAPVVTPASRLALSFTNFTPAGWGSKVGGTQFGTDQPLSLLCPSYNDIYPVSSDRATFRDDAGSEGSVTFQIYPAGLAGKAFTDQKVAANSCKSEDGSVYLAPSNVDLGADNFAASVSDSGGRRYELYAWLDGDVVVYVTSTSTSTRDTLAASINQLVDNELTSSCVRRTYSFDEFKRNPWGPMYEGYSEDIIVRVTPTEELQAIAAPASLGTEIPLIPEVIIPVRPSKTVWPEFLPSPVKAPRQLIDPGFIPETSSIPRALADAQGPGCGWLFTGSQQPPFDAAAANSDLFAAIQNNDAIMKEQQLAWGESAALFWKRFEPFLKKVDLYTQYADELTVIGNYWESIQQQRDAYKVELNIFREQVGDSKKFIVDQNAARIKYETEVAWCLTNPLPVVAKPEFDELGNLIPSQALITAPVIICPVLVPAILSQTVPITPVKPVRPEDPAPPVEIVPNALITESLTLD
jgi:hypothetical protein